MPTNEVAESRGASVPTAGQESSDVSVRKVKSAVRTVELLEYLAGRQDRPARIPEICAALDMPRSSAHALLRTLVTQGWVRSETSGTQYGIGIRALLVGTSYLDADPYLPVITPFLDDLRQVLDETFHIGRIDGSDVVYLATRESRQYMRRRTRSAAGCPPTPRRWARRCSPSASAPNATPTSRPPSHRSPRTPSPTAPRSTRRSKRPGSGAMPPTTRRTRRGCDASPSHCTTCGPRRTRSVHRYRSAG